MRQCGKPGQLQQSIDRIRAKDQAILKHRNALEAENPNYVHGLTTANVGSVYDVPDGSTMAGSSDAASY